MNCTQGKSAAGSIPQVARCDQRRPRRPLGKAAWLGALMLALLSPAAQGQATLEMMRLKMRQFDYPRVASLADSVLHQSALTPAERSEILETKGIALYSLQELDGAQRAFAALLTAAPDHTLDPARTSPKIIQFFDEIKASLARQHAVAAPVRVDTLRIYDTSGQRLTGALARSLVWPGWGHLQLQRRPSGAILAAANLLLLGSTLYAAADCRDKQRAYLAATDDAAIAACYKSYNTAYKTRNALAASYALFWMLSQADLLLLHPPAAGPAAARIVPQVEWTGDGIRYSCTIPF